MAIAHLFRRSERKQDHISQYIGIENLIEKLREIGKRDYIVLVSGDALNDFHSSILVISLSGNKSKEEIEKDFNSAFGKHSSFYDIGDSAQAFRSDETPIVLVSLGDMIGYRKNKEFCAYFFCQNSPK